MLKNNNQTAIKRLSARSMVHNRTRNLFAILAVVLTTFMFTSVFSVGLSMAQNMNTMNLRKQGTKTSITLAQPDREQISQAEKAQNLHAAGIKISSGIWGDEKGKTSIVLDYYNQVEFEENFKPAISDMEGAYPAKADEIMISSAGLEALQIKKPVLGMEIVLFAGKEKKSFVLSGWFTDYVDYGGDREFQSFVSKAYMEGEGLTEEKDGVLCLSSRMGRQDELREELRSLVELRDGQEFDVSWDVQTENGGNMLVIMAVIGFIAAIIILSGYLLIYNVMYISVTKDIRFYGMLKTLGTSPSQIRKLVKMQTARFSAYGIPVGMLLGAVASFVIVPYSMKIMSSGVYSGGAMPKDIHFHPIVYMGTVLFAVLTVAVSSRKPAKLASRVSAVEALRYNGQNAVKMRARKSTDGGKIYRMAFRNVFREKKRALLVFVSLFMGTIAFLSVDTFLGCMKLENYIEYYLPDDYTIYTTATEKKSIQAAEELAAEIEEVEGVEEVSVQYCDNDAVLAFDEEVFQPFLEEAASFGDDYGDDWEDEDLAAGDEQGTQNLADFYKSRKPDGEDAYSAPVIEVSSSMIKRYNERARSKIDIKRFERGEVCLIGTVMTEERARRMEGKTITLTDRSVKKAVQLEIGSCTVYDKEYGINIGFMWQIDGAPSAILVSKNAMEKLCSAPAIDTIRVNCDKEKESSVTARLKGLIRGKSFIRYTEIKSEQISGFRSSMSAMNICGGGMSLVLILIGIINFINVMLTGVFTRRGELAVMESIGMTKKQVKRMLVCEGGYYGAVTALKGEIFSH